MGVSAAASATSLQPTVSGGYSGGAVSSLGSSED